MSDINYRITSESLKDVLENPMAIHGQDIQAIAKELLERRACDGKPSEEDRLTDFELWTLTIHKSKYPMNFLTGWNGIHDLARRYAKEYLLQKEFNCKCGDWEIAQGHNPACLTLTGRQP